MSDLQNASSPSIRSMSGPMFSSVHTTRKRKRNQDDRIDVVAPTKKQEKKKLPNKSKMYESKDKMNLNLLQSVSTAIGKMDSSLLADHVAQKTKHFASDLSLVELEDQRIPEKAFLDTSEWSQLRTLEQLPDFLDRYAPRAGQKEHRLASASKALGSPHTLVVTGAGLRAAELTRTLRTFQNKDAIVAKLFAKHIKLREAAEYVKNTRIGIGVGTPARIIDLLNSGALSSAVLKRVLVDCSYIDQKKRGILDMRETQEPLIRLLNRPDLKGRYGDGPGDVQLIVY